MSGSVTSTTGAGGAATAATTRLGADLNTFLTMLTTQLQNQDPTNPLDTNQMTNQLVQFASVEQQIAMNQNLTSLISLQQSTQLTAAAPMIGRRVEVDSNRVSLQNGSAEVRLPAAGTARTAEITVTDTAGRTLRRETVTLGPGATSWTWDGRNGDGAQQPDGAYAVAVVGRDANGTAMALSHAVRGTLTGAQRGHDRLTLSLGALSLSFDSLRSILPDG
ncbi:flagellar hook assembly protein FlgD [Roseomonas terrae]|uniref:Basal-body rod modification protein FlgD n=1 Tax=Neoroseomonas terrae TaxID=424799 RepID=A0ABS5EHK7_9PROT|nr:flagellar hook assembly protein FlgD [Neoroseomonas terrae]MBR0650519.1 flagellar hook assembly protein FlgD [Neoroseomonas terrae]